MNLLIDTQGLVMCLYGEAFPFAVLGEVTIRRASHVEPDSAGRWWANLAPVAGPVLGPFGLRSEALAAEAEWLECWLSKEGTCSSG